jgi:tetratricopeptide (TPR) repeat protein
VAENHIIDSLKNELQKAKEDTTKVNTLIALSNELINIGDTNGMKYAYRAKELADRNGFRKGMARAWHVIGRAYYGQGNYEAAKENFLQSLKIKTEIGDQQGIADSYNSIGLIYQNEGSYPEALKYYLLALKIYESPELASNSKKGIANVYMNIGSVYLYQSNYPEALKNYFQSLKMMEQIGNKRGMAQVYSNIGVVYHYQNNNELALKNHEQALKLNLEIGNIGSTAMNYNNIGLTYKNEGNYPEALKNYFAALKTSEGNGNNYTIANVYLNIGNVFTKQKKFIEAREYLNKSVQLSEKIGSKNTLMECYSSLATLAEATGDYKSAYQYHQLFSDVKDSLLNETNSKQIAEMKTKYETEKKDKDIELLNKDKEIQGEKIGKQKATIRYFIGGFLLLVIFALVSFRLYNQRRKAAFQRQVSETEMKALLSQIDSHFISNTLVSIKNYLYDNDRQSSISMTDKFAVLMREVLANSRKKEITLSEDFDALKNYLQIQKINHHNKFDFEITIAEEINPDESLVPPMMIQPFVENSIKHGFKEMSSGGMIRINVHRNNSSLVCTVEDNGIGRKKAAEINTTTPPKDGFRIQRNGAAANEGLGMEVIKDRLEILNMKTGGKARFEYEDILDDANNIAGTRIRLFLPCT